MAMSFNSPVKNLVIASDHAGFELKEALELYLKKNDIPVVDLGTNNDESVDYPDYGIKLAKAISEQEDLRGILICGSGIGMSIVVNKFPNIRGALCHNVYTAQLSRAHNDSNVLIMGGNMIGKGMAAEMVRVWLETEFEGGRHAPC